jgi:ribose 5-phosphate isomerase B
MKVAIGSDHAGFDAKAKAIHWLNSKNYTVLDVGTYTADSVDYPDFAHRVAEEVASGAADLGVLICGSANGVAMSANKHAEIRAAICWLPEIAALARQHNDANVCCLPARFISDDELTAILDAYFTAEFEGGRHARRVEKISCS